jgi:putative FmdB family regulatory protein
MPLYEYECATCGYRFERLLRVADAPTSRECPECGASARRKIGAPALQFKGSGWYVNDYGKGKDRTNGDKHAEPKNGDHSKSTETKTDTAKTDTAKTESSSSKTDSASSKPAAASAA